MTRTEGRGGEVREGGAGDPPDPPARGRSWLRALLQRRWCGRPLGCHRRWQGALTFALLAPLLAACSSGSGGSSATTTSLPAHHVRAHRVGASALVGMVTSLDATTMVVKAHGKSTTVALTPSTAYRQGHQHLTASSLRPGARVRISLVPGASTPTARAVVLLPLVYAGTLAALSRTGFALRSPSGATRAITTTSSTTYRQGKSSAAASALEVGEKVRVSSETGPGGSLTATKVVIEASS